jgi:hypothetical protein
MKAEQIITKVVRYDEATQQAVLALVEEVKELHKAIAEIANYIDAISQEIVGALRLESAVEEAEWEMSE